MMFDSPHVMATLEFEQPSPQIEPKFIFNSIKFSGIYPTHPLHGPRGVPPCDASPVVIYVSATAHHHEHISSLGTMSITPRTFSNDGSSRWMWELSYRDIEEIQERNYGDRDIRISYDIQVIVEAKFEDERRVIHLSGSNYFTISRSNWNFFLQSSNYKGKFTDKLDLSSAVTGERSWEESARKLADARRQLQTGNTYAALEGCLAALESVTSAPYHAQRWEDYLVPVTAIPTQKREAIAKLFAGIGTYLNRVGHHHSRAERDINTDELMRPPLDAYEAEILVGITQLAVTYIERLKMQFPMENVEESN